jgi:hypothetical protein
MPNTAEPSTLDGTSSWGAGRPSRRRSAAGFKGSAASSSAVNTRSIAPARTISA